MVAQNGKKFVIHVLLHIKFTSVEGKKYYFQQRDSKNLPLSTSTFNCLVILWKVKKCTTDLSDFLFAIGKALQLPGRLLPIHRHSEYYNKFAFTSEMFKIINYPNPLNTVDYWAFPALLYGATSVADPHLINFPDPHFFLPNPDQQHWMQRCNMVKFWKIYVIPIV